MQQAAEYWSAKAITGYARNWFHLCAPVICERITGSAVATPTAWATKKFSDGRRLKSILELGCLSGDKLSTFAKVADRLVGIDIVEAAVRRGAERHGNRLSLSTMDLNDPVDMDERFDVILANGVLHHIERLEGCLDWIRRHLTDNGALIASEYTGLGVSPIQPQRSPTSTKRWRSCRQSCGTNSTRPPSFPSCWPIRPKPCEVTI